MKIMITILCTVAITTLVVAGVFFALNYTSEDPKDESLQVAEELRSETSASDEERFVSYVRDEIWYLEAMTDSEILQMGFNACATFETKGHVRDLMVELTKEGMNEEGSYLIAAAVVTLCPEHQDKV